MTGRAGFAQTFFRVTFRFFKTVRNKEGKERENTNR